MKLSKQSEIEILQAYADSWKANLASDMDAFASYLTDDFSIFGTANGEHFFGKREAIDFYAATADQLRDKIQLRNREISVQQADTDVAIVLERCDAYVNFENEWIFYGHTRISCVMKHLAGTWKAVHQHASFPDHRTEEGQQLAAEKIAQENLELREAVNRRTVELAAKNRDLEIEAAVEKVRSKAMAMFETSDLAKVNAELYVQLKQLDIPGLTGVAIYLFDEAGIVTVWDLSSPGSMSDVRNSMFQYDYHTKPLMGAFVDICKKGDQDYFVLDFPKDLLWQAVAEMEQVQPEVARHFANALNSGALTHQWNPAGRLSNGMLSLDMVIPPTNEVKAVTLKMAAAFNLAYLRFLDLQNAEAQTREAQINLAVERVRARALAMFKSDEILDVVVKMKDEITGLKLPNVVASTIHLKEKDGRSRIWDITFSDEAAYSHPIDISYALEKTHPDFFMRRIWANQSRYFVEHQDDADLANTLQWLRNMGRDEQADETEKWFAAYGIKHVYHPTIQLNNGRMSIDMLELPAPEVETILEKMGAAFDLAYKRFEDLKNSEAQLKESQIQLALERVRARTMAMQHSDELADASFVLDSQVRALGIETRGCAFNIYGENDSDEWFSSANGALPMYKTPREDLFLRYYQAGQSGAPIYIESFEGAACTAHYDYLCTVPIMGDALRGMIAAGGSFPEKQVDHATYFKYGYLLFITLEAVPDAHEIFIRFAKVFEQTYTRFLDLKKAEAQTLQAEKDLLEIKIARKKAEDALDELRVTQKQLIQSEKMASLGELTAGIAHEIQNPLNFVNNFSEISNEMIDEILVESQKSHAERDEDLINENLSDIKQNLEKINHHGKRADAIVKGMLQHSRMNSGTKEPTDINALADEYLRLAYHGIRAKDKTFNTALETDFDASVTHVDIVPQDIGRVILNLISNAFHAVDEKKKSGIGNYEPLVAISSKKEQDNIIISIKDNGNGIPSAIADKIFQPFFTTKPTGQGTGLGLSLAYDIVKAHGGELKVKNQSGPGAEFTITLPTA